MKKLRTILASLLLIMSLSTVSYHPSTVHAQDRGGQGGGDTTKKPPCYPRCRPLPTIASVPNTFSTASASNDAFSVEDIIQFVVLNFTRFL